MLDQSAQLKQLILFLEDSLAIDIMVIDVKKQTTVTDYMIITSGRSSRHLKAIAESAMERMKGIGCPSISSHGLQGSDWALVDFGDFVLHVMEADSRAFYNLEGLWQTNASAN